MFILDDIVMAPFRGIFWIFRKIDESARAELDRQKQQATSELSELYMQLDTGKLSEQEFEERERACLDRLDAIKASQTRQAGAAPGGAKGHAPRQVDAHEQAQPGDGR